MNRCVCSSRSLEIFLSDVAGLRIPSGPRRSTYRLNRSKWFGTRPALKAPHLDSATSTSAIPDDTYVPFDLPLSGSASSNSATGPRVGRPPPLPTSSKKVLKELRDFEPALEIHRDVVFADGFLEQGEIVESQPVEQASIRPTPEINDIHHHAIDEPASKSTTTVPKEIPENANADKPNTAAVAPWTRGERRKARKARRVESGKLAVKTRVGKSSTVSASKVEGKPTIPKASSVKGKATVLKATSVEAKATLPKTSPFQKPRGIKKESQTQGQERKTATAPSKRAPKVDKATAQGRMPKTFTSSAKSTETRTGSTSTGRDPRRVISNKDRETWQVQKAVMTSKFGELGWNPRKRISPDALVGIKALHTSQSDVYTTPVLAEHFKVSPDAIRRILKSKWQPKEEEVEDRRTRWEQRGVKKWSEMVKLGIRPPKKWRDQGVGRGEKGEAPLWKQGAAGKVQQGRGERWIPQANADLVLRAADAQVEGKEAEFNLADRIL